MATADTQTTNHEAPAKTRKPRADKGTNRSKVDPNNALIDVLKAIQGLSKADTGRVLDAAASFAQIDKE